MDDLNQKQKNEFSRDNMSMEDTLREREFEIEQRIVNILSLCAMPKSPKNLMITDVHLGGILAKSSLEQVFSACQRLFDKNIVDMAVHNGEMVVFLQVPVLTDVVEQKTMNYPKIKPEMLL